MSLLGEHIKELNEKHLGNIVKFVSDLRNGKLTGSCNIALGMVTLLEQIIAETQSANAIELCSLVGAVGKRVCGALPQEPVVANMVRRVLRAIRDENTIQANQSAETGGGAGAGESLQRLVLARSATARRHTLGPAAEELRESLRDHIAELRNELEGSTSSICSQAREHVHGDELILTYGASALAEKFLKAAVSRRYRLILAEGPRVAESHLMAARLSASGVPVTVIGNAAVCAVMSRVNKVVLGVRAALAGGAVLAAAGAHLVTVAARHYSVPVIALAPLYKLAPVFACDQHNYNSLQSPHRALPYQSSESGSVHVYAPTHDFVPADHVTLFVTNLGGSSPSYIYRLLSELYDPKDYQI